MNNHEPTIEELGQIAQRRAASAPPTPELSSAEESLPAWLRDAIENGPPPPLSNEETLRQERADRFFEVAKLRDRLPPFLRAVRLKDLGQRIGSQTLFDLARTWTPQRGNALLMGDTGKGKTTAAGCMALRILQDGVRNGGHSWELAKGLRWFRAEELERAMRAHPLGRGECPAYITAINAKVLILDEIGWEKDHKAIASVLATRYDGSNLTIVTTGQQLRDLREMYGDAIVRRIITYKGRPSVMASDFDSERPKLRSVAVGAPGNPQHHSEVD